MAWWAWQEKDTAKSPFPPHSWGRGVKLKACRASLETAKYQPAVPLLVKMEVGWGHMGLPLALFLAVTAYCNPLPMKKELGEGLRMLPRLHFQCKELQEAIQAQKWGCGEGCTRPHQAPFLLAEDYQKQTKNKIKGEMKEGRKERDYNESEGKSWESPALALGPHRYLRHESCVTPTIATPLAMPMPPSMHS
ncbi:hypothetical protein L345_06195, partial [Ophiophagus hannah]